MGDAAGTELERALRRVEEANNKAMRGMLRDLQRLGPEGKAAADELRAQFTAAGTGDFKTVDGILADLAKLSPAAAEAAGAVREKLAEADKEGSFEQTLAAMQGLGGRAAEVAAGIKAELKTADADPNAFANYLAKLAALDPAAADAAARVQARLAESDRSDQFRETLASLRELGPEGAAIARGIEKEMRASAAESAGGMEPILRKLEELEPTAATAAARIRSELAEADARTRFDTSLAELRKINPAAAKAAEAVRSELSQADKEVKFDSIIAELQELDPASADAARKLRDNMKAGAEGAGDAIDKFAEFSTGKLAAVVASFGGISGLISKLTQYMEEQTQGQKDSRDYQARLAEVQQEALKGYVSLSPEERDYYINVAPAQIADAVGVDRIEVTRALGTIDSSATTEQAVDAVTAAAQINVLTPDKISDYASGAVSIGRSTGLDAKSSVSLMQSLYDLGNVKDLQKIANLLSPAIQAAVVSAPNQDPVDAAADTTSLLAVTGKGLGDEDGARTLTAFNTLASQMQSMFAGLDKEMIASRSAIETIEIQVARAEGAQQKDIAERDRLTKLIAEVEQVPTPDRSELDKRIEAERLSHEGKEIDARQRISVIDKKPEGEATEKDRFERRNLSAFLSQSHSNWEEQKAKLEADWEQKQTRAESQRAERLRSARRQLEAIELRLSTTSEFEKQLAELARHKAFLADAEGFQDPGTIMGRFNALQQYPGLQEQFLSKSFGGEGARPVFEALLDANNKLAQELAESRQEINPDPAKFEELNDMLANGSPQLRSARFAARTESRSTSLKAGDTEGVATEEVRSTLERTLQDTRADGVMGWLNSLSLEGGIRPGVMNAFGGLAGGSAAEELVDAINRLIGARAALARDGIDASEVPKIERIDKGIEDLKGYIFSQAASLAEGSPARAADRAEDLSVRFRREGFGARAEYFEQLARDFRRVADSLETQNRMIAEQTELQAQTAENTTPQPEPPPDYHAITGGSLAQEDAR